MQDGRGGLRVLVWPSCFPIWRTLLVLLTCMQQEIVFWLWPRNLGIAAVGRYIGGLKCLATHTIKNEFLVKTLVLL